jgi:S-DNA-T family DNA segregation ATPase FtsK/SpoIIIE
VQKSERVEKEKQASLFDDRDSELPPLSLLDEAPPAQETVSIETLEFTSRLIEKKLSDFGVEAKVVAAYPGPVITRYEIEPATGVKGSQIVNLARDLARSLSLTSIRVVETIRARTTWAGAAQSKRQIVRLTEILGSKVYNDSLRADRGAGQGHRRQAGGGRPGQDAALAGGRYHRFGQVGGHQRHHSVAAVQVRHARCA